MSAGNVFLPMPMITVDSSTLNDVTYTEVTSGGLDHPAALLSFINSTTHVLLVSYDGVTDHDAIYVVKDIYPQRGATPTNWVSSFSRGTKIFLKLSGMPGVGNIYISAYYNQK